MRERSIKFRSMPASRKASDAATSAHAERESKRRVFNPGMMLAGRNGSTRKARRSPGVLQAVMALGCKDASVGMSPASGP